MTTSVGSAGSVNDAYIDRGWVPPEHLLQKALEQGSPLPEPEVDDYEEVIVLLHDDQGRSFRDIVKFLQEHGGIKTNRSTVYRIYREAMIRESEAEDEPLIDPETGETVEE